MIVTRMIALRIAVLVLVAVVLQVSFFSYLSVLGAIPYLLPVVVASLGLLGGALIGAVCGFVTGLLLDSVLIQPLGVSSLVLLSVGYLAGRYREGFEVSNALVPPLLVGGFALLSGIGFAALQLMLGVETAVGAGVLHEIVVQSLLAVVLAVPVYPLVRRTLRAALVDDLPPRRLLAPAGVRRGRGRARDRPRGRRGDRTRGRGGSSITGGGGARAATGRRRARRPAPRRVGA